MEQNENVEKSIFENNGYENFDGPGKYIDIGFDIESKVNKYGKISWQFFIASIIIVSLGVIFPWMIMESGWKHEYMLIMLVISIICYAISYIYARRGYDMMETKITKEMYSMHTIFLILSVVIGANFLAFAYILWIFSGFAPYPQPPFWEWLLR